MTDPSVFWSPSDQDNNKGLLDKHEQFYAQQRALAGSRVLLAHKVPVRVSQYGTGDDVNGWAASVREGDDYGADIYLADHTNAGNGRSRGVHMYVWRDPATGKLDPRAVRLAECIIARVKPSFAASFKRSWPRGAGRISPARPTSPNTISFSGSALFFKDDVIARSTARSPAGSPILTPPTALTKTS